LVIVVPLVGAVFYGFTMSTSSGVSSNDTSSRSLDGQVFLKALAGFDERYKTAPNDIKQSAIFTEARDWEKSFFKDSTQVTNWKGEVDAMVTPKGGDELSVRVKFGKGSGLIVVSFEDGFGLFNNMKKGTPVYAQAAELKEDDCVLFSGQVEPKENSSTESGAMRSPEYKIKFSSLKPCK
jgi:hypothetical protein